jgi:hypothetical protein
MDKGMDKGRKNGVIPLDKESPIQVATGITDPQRMKLL